MGRQRPKHTETEERLAVVMSANALVQLLVDVVLEGMHIVPTRVNHLSLTVLNAFISYKTLSAIRKNRFSFMHEDCQILWLMEICLIAGDIYYSVYDEFGLTFIFVRLFFIVCSLFNFFVVTYIMLKYQLWSISYKGHGKPSARENVLLAFRAMSRSMGSFRSMGSANHPPTPLVDPAELMEGGGGGGGGRRDRRGSRGSRDSRGSKSQDEHDPNEPTNQQDDDDEHEDYGEEGGVRHYDADDADMDKEFVDDGSQQNEKSEVRRVSRSKSFRNHVSFLFGKSHSNDEDTTSATGAGEGESTPFQQQQPQSVAVPAHTSHVAAAAAAVATTHSSTVRDADDDAIEIGEVHESSTALLQ